MQKKIKELQNNAALRRRKSLIVSESSKKAKAA